MTDDSRGDTPIFDEVARLFGVMVCVAPLRHAGGQPCHGCQSCLAELCDIDDAPDVPGLEVVETEDGHGEDAADVADHGGRTS
jgi:hypothetical protein